MILKSLKNQNMQLLVVLFFLNEFIGDVEVTVEVKACRFVMKVGTGLALVKKFQCLDWLYIQAFSQFHGNGTDAVAQDNFLDNR